MLSNDVTFDYIFIFWYTKFVTSFWRPPNIQYMFLRLDKANLLAVNDVAFESLMKVAFFLKIFQIMWQAFKSLSGLNKWILFNSK